MVLRSLGVDYCAGSHTPVHTHPWPQLLYTQQGSIRAEIGGVLRLVSPRRAFWIPAGTAHRLEMLNEVQLRTLYFQPDHLPAELESRVMRVTGLFHEAILRVCELGWLDARRQNHRVLLDVILAELAQASTDGVELVLPQDPRALRLASHLLHAADADLESALLIAGLGRRTAERLFVRETGISPARWLRWVRLTRGQAELMKTGSVDEAARIAGYDSRSAFVSAFTQTFGYSPAELGKSADVLTHGE